MNYLDNLIVLANRDAEGLLKAAEHYGDSWKRRGGVGAFMMLARKWDRLELAVQKHNWDIFKLIQHDFRAEGAIDDIRDLRRYLLLVEAEMLAQGFTSASTVHRDNASSTDSALPS